MGNSSKGMQVYNMILSIRIKALQAKFSPLSINREQYTTSVYNTSMGTCSRVSTKLIVVHGAAKLEVRFVLIKGFLSIKPNLNMQMKYIRLSIPIRPICWLHKPC